MKPGCPKGRTGRTLVQCRCSICEVTFWQGKKSDLPQTCGKKRCKRALLSRRATEQFGSVSQDERARTFMRLLREAIAENAAEMADTRRTA